MTPNEYQQKAHTFAVFPGCSIGNCLHPVSNLNYKAGKLSGIVAKMYRIGNSTDLCDVHYRIMQDTKTREQMKRELGSVAWFLSETCIQLGLPLEDVLKDNIQYLENKRNKCNQ